MTGVVWGLLVRRFAGRQTGQMDWIVQGLCAAGMVFLGPTILVAIAGGGLAKSIVAGKTTPAETVDFFTGLVVTVNIVFWLVVFWGARRVRR